MTENEYEQIQFDILGINTSQKDPYLEQSSIKLLSQKEENDLLSTIKLQESENLLDLSFEEENQTIKNIQYLEFVKDRIVSIQPPTTVVDGYLVSYKLYKIKTRKKQKQEFDTTVERRFSDFQYLHSKLQQNYGGCVIPKLPEKNIWASFDMETFEDKKMRKNGLERYIVLLLRHEKVRSCEEMREFLFDTRNNFSEKKGQFTSQIKFEDKLKKLTSSAYIIGSSLFNQYFYPETQEKYKINLNRTKEDTQVIQYQLLIKQLIETSKQLKVIVEGTVIQINSLKQISQICDFSQNLHKGINSQILLTQYEDFCEFVESCQIAVHRRQRLRQELQYLKIQQQKMSIKNKNNPRSMELDLIHSEIKKKTSKCKKWTKDLLAELQPQINYGKSLINSYINMLSITKSTLYSS